MPEFGKNAVAVLHLKDDYTPLAPRIKKTGRAATTRHEDNTVNTDGPNRLGSEPIGRLLLQFSLPAIVSMTVISLYHIISSIFIGQSEGALAITGLTVTFPFMNLALAVCMMVAIGAATLCSIELGGQRHERAAMVLGNAVTLSIVLAVSFSLPCQYFLEPILRLFGASDASLPYAREYMEIMLWATPITNTMATLNHLMRASGYPTRSMLVSLLSVGLNLILTPFFIFYCHMGIRGAAVATVFSQFAALVAMLFHFCRRKYLVHFTAGSFLPRRNIVKSIISVGTPPFFINACACLVVVMINTSLRHYGGDLAIGAYGIANRLLLLFAMIIFGLTQGMQPLVGFNFGARLTGRVQQTLRYGLIAATVITSGGFLAFQLLTLPLASLFTTHPELIATAVNGLRLCSMAFFLVGCQIVITVYFQSMGRAPIAIFLSLSRQLVFLIPGILILPLFWGVDGIWLSIPLADTLSFLVSLFILLRSAKNAGRAGPA